MTGAVPAERGDTGTGQGLGPSFYNRMYSAREAYGILYRGLRTMPRLVKAKRNGELSGDCAERIMLAVTHVNGCEVCSYVHSRMALERGMSADSRGNPARESWLRLVDTYGSTKAHGILGAARAMMIGNAYGIAWSAFVSRLKGRPVARSSLRYEVVMVFAVIPHLLIALVHAAGSALCRTPIIGWSSSQEVAGR